MFGLNKEDIKLIIQVFESFEQVEKVIVFGSRAMGNYKKGSDIDIAIVGDKVDSSIISSISDILNNQKPLPYFFDVLNYNEIKSEDLKTHISNFGKVFFQK